MTRPADCPAVTKFVLLPVLGLLALFAFSVPAAAATLTVNSLLDTSDGDCDPLPDDCTLREALQNAGTSDTINFDFSSGPLPVGGPVITLTSFLPDLDEDNLTIDGYDCTGCGPVSENTSPPSDGFDMQIGPTIDGAALSGSSALLDVEADGVTIRGLNLINGPRDGIRTASSGGDQLVVEGCIIGLDRDGFSPAGNDGDGIHLDRGDDIVIGPYNVISGNGESGIEIHGNAPDDGWIYGNLIGTGMWAFFPEGNAAHGIFGNGGSGGNSTSSRQDDWQIGSLVSGEENIISGNGLDGISLYRRAWDLDIVGNVIGLDGGAFFPTPNSRDGIRFVGVSGGYNYPRNSDIEDNVIAGNGGSGIYCHACKDQTVLRNYIGTNSFGQLGLGNGEEGIYLYSSFYQRVEDWEIGSADVADANTIVGNGGDGIRLRTGTGGQRNQENSILVNEFGGNGGLAIDLEAASTGDGPSQPGPGSCSNNNSWGNRAMARPVIDSALLDGGNLVVSGTACSGSTVLVFLADLDLSGYGEPTTYLGTLSLGSGTSWTFTQPATSVAAGEFVTSYAQGADQETGEASESIEVISCDGDMDGVDGPVCGGADCDDTNPFIFPGAFELCDGLDSDCDGLPGPDEIDSDGDGFMVCGGDCDDSSASVSPSAPELCDGLDNDCSGSPGVDEVDADGDGVMICDGDCDDSNSSTFPTATELCDGQDNDCDTVVPAVEDDLDGDAYMVCEGDCDDSLATVNPGVPEVCDGLDTNCDGVLSTGEVDADGDGVLLCEGDCDDGEATIYPGAAELCDGLDNDCDGALDPGEVDLDGDGVLVCAGDCDDFSSATYPGAAELCDGLDNDCDGSPGPTELDADGDGVLVCAGDCDDGNALIYPGALELCDGLDNDCDGAPGVDELDNDGDGVTVCAGDCDDTSAAIFPGAAEVCGDGIDQDCDGLDLLAEDLDGDGYSACVGDCDDSNPTVYTGAEELCDGLDNDCDGLLGTDELDLDGDGYSPCDGDCDDAEAGVHPGALEICEDGIDQNCDGAETSGEDLDGDGHDACTDCDDSNHEIFPGALELCDGLDNDCDGSVGEDEVDLDQDGYLACEDCDDSSDAVHPGAEELCADGIDSDCDGNPDPEDMDHDGDGWDTEDCGGEDCDDADSEIHPAAPDVCEDGVDSDCDGTDPLCDSLTDDLPLVAGGGCADCSLSGPSSPRAPSLGLGLIFLVGFLGRRRRAPRRLRG